MWKIDELEECCEVKDIFVTFVKNIKVFVIVHKSL